MAYCRTVALRCVLTAVKEAFCLLDNVCREISVNGYQVPIEMELSHRSGSFKNGLVVEIEDVGNHWSWQGPRGRG